MSSWVGLSSYAWEPTSFSDSDTQDDPTVEGKEVEDVEEVEISLEAMLPGAIAYADADADCQTPSQGVSFFFFPPPDGYTITHVSYALQAPSCLLFSPTSPTEMC